MPTSRVRLVARHLQNQNLYIELVGDADDVQKATEKLLEVFQDDAFHVSTENIDDIKHDQGLAREVIVLEKQKVNRIPPKD